MWVETNRGWLNLDHVLSIVLDGKEGGMRRYHAIAPNGQDCGYFEMSELRDLDDLLARVIPAAAGVLAHFLYFDEERLEKPPLIEVYPVIGWRFHEEFDRHPVLPADMDFEGVCALQMPDGRFYLPYDRSFLNRDEWIGVAREEAKAKRAKAAAVV